ncbi:hypothetical protein CW310_07700 [Pseudomonas citronellolis]|jgi:hypothetical protein|uniref:three component ABC system middle component n=1 Tax=Pseudomonas TaxID=286 RepID=UPI00068C2021|nr:MULTISPECIES: three component ABC system middle component [Pseudomonas]KWR75278.1 hypothetical protein RN02_23755 [Pseudomonas sp. PI1]MCT5013593.1 DUF6521 family protein [Pseudomonas aeruginosa]MCT5043766.1 DUF6521 family protein [Pseudomonas aeruginosa]MCV3811725.1 DUF6521 family protein [Pseudomonas aeruginosa]TGC30899.1 hypothetical protein CW310_07700 [Pseudomonas citronellolis]
MDLTTTDHIHTLHRSPLILAPILHSFYLNVHEAPRNILLSYLVLPFVLHQPTSAYLYRITDRNSLRTMCSEKSRVAGIHKRIILLRQATNQALFSLINSEHLRIDDELTVQPVRKNIYCPDGIRPQLVSARNLARLFEDSDAPQIYKLLGMTQL